MGRNRKESCDVQAKSSQYLTFHNKEYNMQWLTAPSPAKQDGPSGPGPREPSILVINNFDDATVLAVGKAVAAAHPPDVHI